MTLVYHDDHFKIYHGNAADWSPVEHVDLVFTNPYGPMPTELTDTPAIIHQWDHRKADAERWSGMSLGVRIGRWNRDKESFWVNDAMRGVSMINVSQFVPEEEGWYPIEMVRRILSAYALPGQVVWDGFMGRGTIAKVCREMGLKYIGIEQLEKHIDIATKYLEIDG